MGIFLPIILGLTAVATIGLAFRRPRGGTDYSDQ